MANAKSDRCMTATRARISGNRPLRRNRLERSEIMRFMMLMIPKGYEQAKPGTMPDAKAVAAMMKYNEELQKAGVLLVARRLASAFCRRAGFVCRRHAESHRRTLRGSERGGRRVLDDPGELEAGSDRLGEAVSWFGERDHRDPPGPGDGRLHPGSTGSRRGIRRVAGRKWRRGKQRSPIDRVLFRGTATTLAYSVSQGCYFLEGDSHLLERVDHAHAIHFSRLHVFRDKHATTGLFCGADDQRVPE